MKPIVTEVLIDLILEDVLNDGHLFESNPYHDAGGKFTSKGAGDLYKAGALAFGRAKGMKAKAQGLGKDAIRSAIKAGIEQHLTGQGDRKAGEARLALIRGKVAKGTLPAAPAPKAPRPPRTTKAPKAGRGPGGFGKSTDSTKEHEREVAKLKAMSPGTLQAHLDKVLKVHRQTREVAREAEKKIVAREGKQQFVRGDWKSAHQKMEKTGEKIADIVGVLDQKAKAEHPDEEQGHQSPKIDKPAEFQKGDKPVVVVAKMSAPQLHVHLADLEKEHAGHQAAHDRAQKDLRDKATHSQAGQNYQIMQTAHEKMGKLQKRMKVARELLQKKKG